MSHRSLLALVAIALTAGCGEAEKLRKERDAVVAKIDALRDSDKASLDVRRKLLKELEGVESKSPDCVAAREACASAYRSLIESKAQSEEATNAMSSGERVDPVDMSKKLETAGKLLERSEEDMPKCDQALTKLRTAKL